MGRIHPEAEDIHFSKNPDHRELVRPFLIAFDVTRGSWTSKGQDRVACFFLKAEPFIAELIGLEREVLLVYSPFPELQARTIKLHDEVVTKDRTRVDPLGTILVSDDVDTTSKVRNLTTSDPERPPIVALSRAQVASIKDANALRSLLFSELYQRDLFALESPLRTDTTFFGREDVTNLLLDRIRSGQNSGLFGLRRIGKTSVLYALRRRAESGAIAGTAFLDVSSPAVYRSRWWELLQRVAREFAGPLGLERGARTKIRALTLTYDENQAASHFKADILGLAKFFPEDRLVVLLDEIEHITFDIGPAPHWNDDFLPFWQTLRSVHQDTQGLFGYIVAGVNPHILEADRVGRFDNPLFSTTKSFYLAPFDYSNARAMVRKIGRFMGLRVAEDLYPQLIEEYGGHPFLIRQACSHLARHVTSRPGEVPLALFKEHRKEIAIALDKNVRQILNVLAIWYPEEYELLRELALGEAAAFSEFAEASASFTEHVEGYGLVSNARTCPSLRIGLVRDHLARVPRSVGASAAKATDPEAVLSEISRRRNAIEVALRRVLQDGLRFGKGAKAGDAALGSLPSERRAVLMQYSYDTVWQEMYFNELAAVLRANWEHFEKFFGTERETVLGWLDQINRCRADAHARALGEEDLAYLRVCFKRMEDALRLA